MEIILDFKFEGESSQIRKGTINFSSLIKDFTGYLHGDPSLVQNKALELTRGGFVSALWSLKWHS